MFNIKRNGENRVDIALSGKLDSGDMRVLLDDLIEQAQDISHGVMLYRIVDIGLPTFGAIGVELSRFPELFRLINRFDKIAVVADQSWIRTASQIEGALIPGMTIKAFDLGQETDAEAWLAV